MQRITEYLKERNIPKDSLEANSILEGYELGVEKTKKEIIEKACEWLKENIDLYSYNAFNTKPGYTEITLTDVFKTAFRQAMEE